MSNEPWSSFWRLGLRTIPIITVVGAASVLAYFVMLRGQHSQPYAQIQQPTQQVAQQESQQTKPNQQAPAVLQPAVPSDNQLVILIMSTLVALNQANLTGNYTVLRDMGAPGLQTANSPAKLAEAFANLRHRNLDLSPILLFQPKLFRKPEVNAKGMLRVTGFFPTKPDRVNFDLIFQPVQGRWRLFGIAVDTSRAQPAATPPVAAQSAPGQAASPPPSAAAPERKPPDDTPANKPRVPDIRDKLEMPEVDVGPDVNLSPETQPKPKENYNPFSRF